MQRRPGVGDGDEVRARSALRLRVALRELSLRTRFEPVHQRPEVAIERTYFRRGSALRGDEKERAREIEAVERVADRVGSGRVEHAQIESAGLLAEDARQHVRAQARSTHPQQDAMAEALRCFPGEACQLEGVVAHLLCHAEPPEAVLGDPLVLRIGAPQGDVLRPQPRADLLLGGDLQTRLGRVLPAAEPLVDLHRLARALRLGPRLDGVQQVSQRGREQLEALVGQLAADLLEIDSDLAEPRKL